jgi:hypothetical protein
MGVLVGPPARTRNPLVIRSFRRRRYRPITLGDHDPTPKERHGATRGPPPHQRGHLSRAEGDMQTQARAWLRTIPPDPSEAPFVFDAYLDAHDEFEAAPFIAAHGLYRQATAALRNVLEVMTHAVRFAVRNDQQGFDSWRDGSADPPKFGNSVDLIGRDSSVAAIEARLTGSGLFGIHPDGVLRSLYSRVCNYAHSQPDHTNADIWQSNGPVFIPRAFTQFWLDFCDVLLACLSRAQPARCSRWGSRQRPSGVDTPEADDRPVRFPDVPGVPRPSSVKVLG